MPSRPNPNAKKITVLALVSAGLAIAVAWWQYTPSENLPPPGVAADPKTVEYYQRRVQPILRSNCYHCHADLSHKGGLRLDSPEGILRGGKHGSVLTPGHPEESRLIVAIHHNGSADGTKPMPPKDKISEADIDMLTAWIKAGAIMPTDVAP